MKKTLLLSMLLFAMALVSCNNEDDTKLKTTDITFTVSTPQPPAENTKAPIIGRYIMEVYYATDLNTVAHHIEQTSGTFTLALENNTSYTCLFWVDDTAPEGNTNGTYNATDLKNVTLNTGEQMTDAFFARLDITNDETTFNVTLKRPTAQVNLVETDGIDAGATIDITHNHYNSFNTFSSDVAGTAVSKTTTITPSVTIGILGTYLTFAPVTGNTADFTTNYNSTTSNDIPNVPLHANYKTNLSGSYSGGNQEFTFIIIIDDVWEEDNAITGVAINVGTTNNPIWIKVADRNADKTGANGAATGNTSTDYCYYYHWSNAGNDPTNVEKSYSACFNFGEGNGAWRLPTEAEILAINGDNDNPINDNNSRKIQYENDEWVLYDESTGNEANFVYFPRSGSINNGTGSSGVTGQNVKTYYWSSHHSNNKTKTLELGVGQTSHIHKVNTNETKGHPVRCVRNI